MLLLVDFSFELLSVLDLVDSPDLSVDLAGVLTGAFSIDLVEVLDAGLLVGRILVLTGVLVGVL